MEIVTAFKIYLENLSSSPSAVTIKNYVADVRKFVSWYETTYHTQFIFQQLPSDVIELYDRWLQQQSGSTNQVAAARSIDRYLSSLRRLFIFAKEQGYISQSPFDQVITEKVAFQDTWHLKAFGNYLYTHRCSPLTIKNYASDIKQFLTWTTKVSWRSQDFQDENQNVLHNITTQLIDEYRNRLGNDTSLSPISINRKLSAIRRYIAWAVEQGLITQPVGAPTNLSNPVFIAESMLPNKELPSALKEANVQVYSSFPPLRLAQKANRLLNLLIETTLVAGLVSIIEACQKMWWRMHGRELFKSTSEVLYQGQPMQLKTGGNPIKPKRETFLNNINNEFYAPLPVIDTSLPWHKRTLHHLRHTRPEWYKTYHSYSITHYIHIGILILLMSATGVKIAGMVSDTPTNPITTAFAAGSQGPPRILSFREKLSDISGKPITSPADVRFSLYNDPSSSGSALLWQEVLTVTPDHDGYFTVTLGRQTPLPGTLFTQNSSIYLGTTIGSQDELHPRQPVANEGYAENSQTVQGLSPVTQFDAGTKNVLLALDSTGNLTIGGTASPTFTATGGDFHLSGQTLLLTSNLGSDGNVVLAPDGSGMIDMQKPLVNTGEQNSLGAIPGSVEVDDSLSVVATSSADPAVSIQQLLTGPLLTASSGSSLKFTVDYQGAGMFADDLSVNGGDITTTQTSATLFNTNAINLSVGHAASSLSLGAETGTATINNATTDIIGNLVVDGTTGQTISGAGAGIVFSGKGTHLLSTSNGTLAIGPASFQGNLSVGSNVSIIPSDPNSINNLGSAANPFDTLYVNNIVFPNQQTPTNVWQLNNGTLSPTNTTNDLTIGSNASSSAAFHVFGSGSLVGTASSSGNLTFTGIATSIKSLNGGSINFTHTPGGDTSESSSLFIANNGNIGINTIAPAFKLDIQDSNIATAAARINNNASNSVGLDLQLGYTSTINNSTNHFIDFMDGNGNIRGSIQAYGNGVQLAQNGIADIAEYLPKDNSIQYNFGQIICLSTDSKSQPCTSAYQSIVGVMSDTAVVIGGDPNQAIPVGVSGIVRTQVTTANGPIIPGDYIALSSEPGVGMKATTASYVVGKAVEGYAGPGIKRIKVLITPLWYDPNIFLTQSGTLSTQKDQSGTSEYLVTTANRNPVTQIANFGQATIGAITTGALGVKEMTVDGTAVIKQSLEAASITANHISTHSLEIAGVDLHDYITQTVASLFSGTAATQLPGLVSPVVSTNQINTSIISPLSDDSHISVSLDNSQLAIKNNHDASGSAVVTIDNQGNASFSGTLRAKSIIADQIEGLDSQLASLSGTTITNITNVYTSTSAASEPSSMSPSPTPTPPIYNSIDNTTSTPETPSQSFLNPNNAIPDTSVIDIASLSAKLSVPDLKADTAMISQGFVSLGASSLADVSIAGQLAIGGNTIYQDNTINVLNSDLEIQPLRQGGVSFLAGLVKIDTDGNLQVSGNAAFTHNVQVSGTLTTNILSPLAQHDLAIQLPGDAKQSAGSQVTVQNASQSAVLTINNLGDLIASGAGTFKDLAAGALSIVRGVQADTSTTQTVAQGSAGTATILSGQLERTILTPYVRQDSLIYITPTSDTAGLQPFIARQTPDDPTLGSKGSFTIHVSTPQHKPITVNWWIVN